MGLNPTYTYEHRAHHLHLSAMIARPPMRSKQRGGYTRDDFLLSIQFGSRYALLHQFEFLLLVRRSSAILVPDLCYSTKHAARRNYLVPDSQIIKIACEIGCAMVPNSASKNPSLTLTWWPCWEDSEDNARNGPRPPRWMERITLGWRSLAALGHAGRVLRAQRKGSANLVLPGWSTSVMVSSSPGPAPANDNAADQKRSI